VPESGPAVAALLYKGVHGVWTKSTFKSTWLVAGNIATRNMRHCIRDPSYASSHD
jgi:hypothetical protein